MRSLQGIKTNPLYSKLSPLRPRPGDIDGDAECNTPILLPEVVRFRHFY
jgi:hypothetical protein